MSWEQPELERERHLLPQPMISLGIQNLDFVYVFMWRPVCLSKLSSNNRRSIAHDVRAFAAKELSMLEGMVESHRQLSAGGVMPLVLSFADLLWEPDRSQRRLNEFLPCLGTLDFNFKPKLNKDVFPQNKFKADVSVKQFGESTNPWDCCGYSVKDKTCRDDANFFKKLAPDLEERANEAREYMMALS